MNLAKARAPKNPRKVVGTMTTRAVMMLLPSESLMPPERNISTYQLVVSPSKGNEKYLSAEKELTSKAMAGAWRKKMTTRM